MPLPPLPRSEERENALGNCTLVAVPTVARPVKEQHFCTFENTNLFFSTIEHTLNFKMNQKSTRKPKLPATMRRKLSRHGVWL
eukprot:5421761-Amphidinium_carterae.1